MPRRNILTENDRVSLFEPPTEINDLASFYCFTENDLSLINQRRTDSNRLGFAILLSLLRYPGHTVTNNFTAQTPIVQWCAKEIGVQSRCWNQYSKRDETRREHLRELRAYLNLKPFQNSHLVDLKSILVKQGQKSDKGSLLIESAIHYLRKNSITIPSPQLLERTAAESLSLADENVYTLLTELLTDELKVSLDSLLTLKPGTATTWLTWLRRASYERTGKEMLEQIGRLQKITSLNFPLEIGLRVHQNRVLKLAREGREIAARDLANFDSIRRYAILSAMIIEMTATITDDVIELNDRILQLILSKAKNHHNSALLKSGKLISKSIGLYLKVGRALVNAKNEGTNLLTAIEDVISWAEFENTVSDTENANTEPLKNHRVFAQKHYATIRKYIPQFLECISFKSTKSHLPILDAIDEIKTMYSTKKKSIPKNAPTEFLTPKWREIVIKESGINRKEYEISALEYLKDGLRSGDIWAKNSRQFKDFDGYLISMEEYKKRRDSGSLNLPVNTSFETYINERKAKLRAELIKVNKLAKNNKLENVKVTRNGFTVSPLEGIVPKEAKYLNSKISQLLPRIKITDLILEVNDLTDFSTNFTHLRKENIAEDVQILLTTILADGINLGLQKMADSCPGTTYSKLSWIHTWYIRDETYSAALGTLSNAQYSHPFAKHWGDGTTSSSDGQWFKTTGKAKVSGQSNLKYGVSPGHTIYTHISDQYAPFHTKLVNVGVRDSTYVLDGLLYHESDMNIEEHYTDTHGFTDHVFGLMHLLGFKFAPRLRDIKDTKIFSPEKGMKLKFLDPMLGDTINFNQIRDNWDEIMRIAVSIQDGTVTSSLLIRKLASYSRLNGVAYALRELGQIERSLHILEWYQNPKYRRKVTAGLNKGESRNALSRIVRFNRLGEFRDRSLEQQEHRSSGLNLITAAIVYWNTVEIEKVVNKLRNSGEIVDSSLLQHVSPLDSDHISFTGDYIWKKRGNRNIY